MQTNYRLQSTTEDLTTKIEQFMCQYTHLIQDDSVEDGIDMQVTLIRDKGTIVRSYFPNNAEAQLSVFPLSNKKGYNSLIADIEENFKDYIVKKN